MKNQSYWTGFRRKSVSGIIVFVPNKRLWARLSAISSFIIKHIHTKMNHLTSIGGSIFDNASYVPGQPSVIEQLRHKLPENWKATLLAVDGDVTSDIIKQISRLPEDASHLIISSGGNDALSEIGILNESARSVAEVLERFANIRVDFQGKYHKMLKHVLNLGKYVIICTIYDTIPGLEKPALTALSMFNEIILREAFLAKVPVIDLRLVFSESSDYSELSPIEPSSTGGAKMVKRLIHLLKNYNFGADHSEVYS